MRNSLESEPQDELGHRVTAALERGPVVMIPHRFAGRVALAAAALPTPRASSHFGMLVARVTCGLLLIAMLTLAPWARTNGVVPMAVEMLLVLEFVILAAWLTVWARTT